MEMETPKLKQIDDLFLTYVCDIVQSPAILIIALATTKYLMKAVRLGLSNLTPNSLLRHLDKNGNWEIGVGQRQSHG